MGSKEKFIFDTEHYNKYPTFDILYILLYFLHPEPKYTKRANKFGLNAPIGKYWL